MKFTDSQWTEMRRPVTPEEWAADLKMIDLCQWSVLDNVRYDRARKIADAKTKENEKKDLHTAAH